MLVVLLLAGSDGGTTTAGRTVSLVSLILGVASGAILWRYSLPAKEYGGFTVGDTPEEERTSRWSHAGLALLMLSFAGQAVALYL